MNGRAETVTNTEVEDPYFRNSAIHLFNEGIADALARLPKESRLVDVGAGNGQTTLLFRELGYTNIELVDVESHLDPEILETTPFRQCNVCYEALPYDDGAIDIITAFQVLEHVENPWHMMREVRRCLRPGGYFLTSFPTSKDIKSRLLFLCRGDVLHYREDNNHISFFTRSVQKKLFLGFDIMCAHYTRMPVPGFGKIQRKLGFKFLLPNGALFGSNALYVLKKKPV